MARILLADDDALICEVVLLRLQELGHMVFVVDDGSQVLATVRDARPDLIILDNLMPGKTGTEVLAELKTHSDMMAIPVMMLSAQTGPYRVTDAISAGASDYASKPFDPANLLTRIDGLINMSQNPCFPAHNQL